MTTTEQEYLQLAEDCKNKINEKNEELNKHYEEIKELKKIIMIAYSFTRVLDEFISHDYNQSNILVAILETIRTVLSSAIDKYIFLENEENNIFD